MQVRSMMVITVLSIVACSGDKGDQKPITLETPKDSVSYSLGIDIGAGFKSRAIEINIDPFVRGIKNGQAEEEKLMTDDEIMKTLVAFQKDLKAKQQEMARVQAKENEKAGEDFLKDNAGKDGVVILPSGLQYRIIQAGDGPTPGKTDRVKVHYQGSLVDGSSFDSSYERGKPSEFNVNAVIKGWTEALQIMPVGSKWELVIPSDLAYGPRGSGRKIGPNSTLVFEVELLDIIK